MKGDLNIDFVMAVILFVSVYAILFTLLPSATISFKKTPDPLAATSYYFADILVTTPGLPANWSSISDVTRLGLAYGDNVTSYPNILDAAKVGALTTASCGSLRNRTDVALNFSIVIETSSNTYSCSTTIPRVARLIERVGYVRNNSDYTPAKIKVWVW